MGTWLIWLGLFVGAMVFAWVLCRIAAESDERMREMFREEVENGE